MRVELDRPAVTEETGTRHHPAAVYLLGDESAGVTGVTVTAAGDEIGTLSEPRQVRTGVHEGGWTVDAIAGTFESVADGYDLERTARFL
ncbi:hypothetical protein [Natrinema gelatinilyticum]|uniref:hypothetical protein n=1 Tax=Natrinema gelatinilyticum TaxID=2961571 RepID=UPI0020C2B26E|nr:hypothetical protein [Natrinema gelatinilyticum]